MVWLGSSLADVRAFPDVARQRAGYALGLVQQGLEPPDWRPMPSVGLGVSEIRVRTGRDFRLFYVAKYAEAITCCTHSRRRPRRRRGQTSTLREGVS